MRSCICVRVYLQSSLVPRPSHVRRLQYEIIRSDSDVGPIASFLGSPRARTKNRKERGTACKRWKAGRGLGTRL